MSEHVCHALGCNVPVSQNGRTSDPEADRADRARKPKRGPLAPSSPGGSGDLMMAATIHASEGVSTWQK